MVPIGLLTRNRAAYLDVTLRSLSATYLPYEVPIYVFDDHSDDPTTLRYYSESGMVAPPPNWPATKAWQDAGLYTINLHNQPLYGISKKVTVIANPVGKSTGVVNASCWAINTLFAKHKDAPGVLLLQDDVLLTRDWYKRMLQTADLLNKQPTIELGVLAGIKINQYWDRALTENASYVQSGITAQCLYVTKTAHTDCQGYFKSHHTARMRFDDTLRNTVANAGLWAGSILPFIGQHFGMQSLVRPSRPWNTHPCGRIGHYAVDPLVMTDTVAHFKGK